MATEVLQSPRAMMSEHLHLLRDYARRSLVGGQPLTDAEEDDRATRVAEYMAIGSAFKCTKKELVNQVYDGLLVGKPGCDCFSCKPLDAQPS